MNGTFNNQTSGTTWVFATTEGVPTTIIRAGTQVNIIHAQSGYAVVTVNGNLKVFRWDGTDIIQTQYWANSTMEPYTDVFKKQ
jgi:hypothetical protein